MVSVIFSIISWMEPRETQLKDFQWADTWSRWGMKLLQVGSYSDNPGRDRRREEGQHQGDKCTVRFRRTPENRSRRQKLMRWDNDGLKQQARNRHKHHASVWHAPKSRFQGWLVRVPRCVMPKLVKLIFTHVIIFFPCEDYFKLGFM